MQDYKPQIIEVILSKGRGDDVTLTEQLNILVNKIVAENGSTLIQGYLKKYNDLIDRLEQSRANLDEEIDNLKKLST